jgi:hypothetical protein
MAIREQVNWSEKQDGFLIGAAGNPSYGYCCGCCCYIVPEQVRVTIADMTDTPTGLVDLNGTYDLTWVGHDYDAGPPSSGTACAWEYAIGGGVTLRLSRVWNPSNATPCSSTGDHLWWLHLENVPAGGLVCQCYWSKATSDGGDWAGNYAHYSSLPDCGGATGSSATVGSVP